MVIWSNPAKLDLQAIHNFIATNSSYYAKKVIQNIREKLDILNELPRVGIKIPELNDDTIRELSLYSYRIIYEIRKQDILVLAVVHKRRNLLADSIKNK